MDELSLAKQLLLSSNYWVLNKTLVYEIGIEAAFLLTCMAEAEKMMGDKDGWFYQTINTLEKHSTLTRHKQGIAIDTLIEKGILEQQNRGMPMKRYFRINYHKLSETLINASMRKIDNQGCEISATKDEKIQQPSMKEIDKLVCEKSATNKESSYKENNNKESKYKEKQQSCKPSPTLKFDEGSIELNIALKMRSIMLEIKPDGIVPGENPKDLQNWCQHIDYMLRIDNRDPIKLLEIFDWTQKDDFWVANIRSPRKLREKWDSLELQMNRSNRGNKKTNQNLNNLANKYRQAVEEEQGGLFG